MGEGSGNVLTLVGMLCIVICILFLAYWVTRWIASRGVGGLPGMGRIPNAGRGSGQEELRLLSQLPLGRGERLALVRCGGRCLLLGVTERSITLLRELTDEEAKQWLAREEDAPPPGFLELLRKSIQKDTKEK